MRDKELDCMSSFRRSCQLLLSFVHNCAFLSSL